MKSDKPELDLHYMNGLEMGKEEEPETETETETEEDREEDENEEPIAADVSGTAISKRREFFLKFDGRRGEFEDKYTAVMRGVFQDERERVTAAMKAAGNPKAAQPAALRAASASQGAIRAALTKLYVEVSNSFGVETVEEVAAGEGALAKARRRIEKAEVDFSDLAIEFLGGEAAAVKVADLWKRYVQDWMREEGGKKIVGIDATTRDRIMHELEKGTMAGEGIADLIDRIDGMYGEEIIPNRAQVIARTEVVSASNLGSQASVDAMSQVTGLEIEKQWLSSGADGRTRDAHLFHDAKDAWVDVNAPHEVSIEGRIEKLMFPGDSSLGASPENTIQCRCVQLYRTKKSKPRGRK
jgi:hypothetical protein